MEPTFQLTPESARALALRLFSKEQFGSDPRGCIIAALDWLDRAAAGDNTREQSPSSLHSEHPPLIARLEELVKVKGLEVVAEGIKVGPSTLRSWLRGVRPTETNRKRIEQFFSSETPALTIEQPEREQGGELFTPASESAKGLKPLERASQDKEQSD